ncbi:MAG: DUF2079 domain-containing protein [Nostoc sp. NMS7]|uniref:DUF2079 domain-containing protein n=1 Tax=Nostoc sp. NMS7 TaxID=2815391 RepID=UPI0025FA3931|nr:DUF2079 domain-containing protein [Nostoc sp. NMS7]MBN3948767.1 DUF2079 domain-containing protein [Nostoc sp. NMS7]
MKNKAGLIYISWMIAVSALILFIFSSLRHELYQSTALDLAAFDQWIYLASQGLPPISSFFGFHMIGDHAAFILYLIVPLYKIYPDVHWLFAVQAIALTIGCVPVYALSLQAGLSINYARAISISYLLYPSLFNINFFTDFRPETIAVPALLWAMWAGISHRTWQLIIAIALVLSCKDILSLTVIAFGVWLWLIQHRRIYGIGCIVTGVVWYLITVGYLVPMLRGGQAGGVVFYSSLGDSPKQIIWNIITNPSLILGKFFASETLFYYLLLLLPVIIGLHWRHIMTIIPALPMFLLNILSDYSPQRDLINHYSLTIFPFLIVWLLRSIWQYQQDKKRGWLKPRFLIVWAIIAFLVLAKYEFFITRYLSSLSNLNSLHTAVSLVQTKGSVLTTSRIAPHLSQRQIINLINIERKPDDTSNGSVEYVLLDVRTKNRRNKLEFNPELPNKLKNNQAFKLVYQQDDVYLFKKQ